MKLLKNYWTALVISIASLATAGLAQAQEVAAQVTEQSSAVASTVLNLQPLLEQLLIAAGSAAVFVAMFALRHAAAYFKSKTGVSILEQEDIIRGYVEKALQNGVELAVSRLKDSDFAHIDTKNAAIAEGARYVLNSVPDALRYFKIDEQGIKERIEARFPDLTVSPPRAPRAAKAAK